MRKHLITAFLVAFLLAFAPAAKAGVPIISHEVYGPSPWLPFDRFQAWSHAHLADKPFYIVTTEGRLHNGVSEWRVRWSPSPRNVEWYWYWWFGSTGPQYEAEASSLVGKKGFDQIWLQSFVDAEGVRKYQAIYLKIIWPKNTTPASPSYKSPRANISPPEPILAPTPPAPVPGEAAPAPSEID
jgi:hypothetical protein